MNAGKTDGRFTYVIVILFDTAPEATQALALLLVSSVSITALSPAAVTQKVNWHAALGLKAARSTN